MGSVTKGAESISYLYDGPLVTSETISGTLNNTLSYQYNNDFNVKSFSYAGESEIFTYDNDRLLTGSGDYTITRNTMNGLPESVSDGTVARLRTFNGYGEIDEESTAVGGVGLYANTIAQRDNSGRIKLRTETTDGTTHNFIYNYDDMGRLLTVTMDGTLVEECRYDPNGTRNYEMNSRKGISTPRTFDYSGEDHLLLAGAVNYQHDIERNPSVW